MNIAFLVIVAPFPDLARRRNKLSAVLPGGENNQAAGKTYVYEYDSRGNILSRKTYSYTTGELGDVVDEQLYYYSGDKNTYFDGNYRTYDELGNPINYERISENGAYRCFYFTWEKGRQLASASIGGAVCNYTYDADGIRTSKTVGNTTYKYYTSGGQLQAMTISNGSTVTTTMQFYYNALGTPVAFKYNNTLYYYLTNLQGDVIGILDTNGLCATYTYDAWGRIVDTFSMSNLSETLLNANPLRYRGYIYDIETGFYYLQSRYYDPEVGRFINADSPEMVTTVGLTDRNLYSYCDNNPVMRADDGGEFWNIVVGAVVGAVVGGVSAWVTGGDLKAIIIGAGVGFVGGALAATGIPAVGQLLIGGALNAASNILTQTIVDGKEFENVDWESVALDAAIGLAASAISYGVTKSAADYAESLISKGVNKIVQGKDIARYGKGAVKKGLSIMRSGIKQLHIAQGYSSVLGSLTTGLATTTRQLFMNGV